MGSNHSKVLEEFTNTEKREFTEEFASHCSRFGWGDTRNYIYIQRCVIYTGVKDRVLAKYDNFVQTSILAKVENDDLGKNIAVNAANVSMPDFIHDHYVDYLMAQISSAMDQLCYPDVRYRTERIKLRKNSEDGMQYWLLLGVLQCKLCVSCIDDELKYFARFSFHIAIYSRPIPDDININHNAININPNEGIDSGYDRNDDRIRYLQRKEREKKKRQQKNLEAIIKSEKEAKVKKKKHITILEQTKNVLLQQAIQESLNESKQNINIKNDDNKCNDDDNKYNEEEKEFELKTDGKIGIGSIIDFNSDPEDSDSEQHNHRGEIVAIKKDQWTIKLDNSSCHNYFVDEIKVKTKPKANDKKMDTFCMEQGWKKCPNINCGIYIERVYGCKHMKCKYCNTEFCDCCGKQIDPLNWKKHFLPPNTCRLWDDVDDLLNDNDNFFDNDESKNDLKNNLKNVDKFEAFEVFEEGNMCGPTDNDYEPLFNENIIKQLVNIGLGDRKAVLEAMNAVQQKNNIQQIASYLMSRNQKYDANHPNDIIDTDPSNEAPIPFAENSNKSLSSWQCQQCFNQNKDIYIFCPLCGVRKGIHLAVTNENNVDTSSKSLKSDEYQIHAQIENVQNQLNELKSQQAKLEANVKNAEPLFNENVIKKLMDFGLGDRDKIISAMKIIDNYNDANLIANYLMMANQTQSTSTSNENDAQ